MSFLSSFAAVSSPAATPAAPAFSDPVDSVNSAAGYPAQERYPGAVDPSQYDEGYGPHAGGAGGPLQTAAEPFASSLPHEAPGGGWQDNAWMTGTDGPQAPWDSSAGAPFAPSGAVNPVLHGQDTGAVWIREHVVPAAIGKLTRRTQTGQTTIRMSGDQLTRDNQTAPNGRADLDQYQDWNPNGHDPWNIPYSERAIQNNLAYEAMPITSAAGIYTPSGALPDRSQWNAYPASAYEAPPDPDVSTQAPAAASGFTGGGWMLG